MCFGSILVCHNDPELVSNLVIHSRFTALTCADYAVVGLEDLFGQLPEKLRIVDLRMNGIVKGDVRRLTDNSKGIVRCF